MRSFTTLNSVAAPLPDADIDTDIIFPARFLLLTQTDGLGRYAFHDRRFDADGGERSDFVLHRPAWRQARIVVAGANFGCGSSREQAAWALADLGVRCIVAPSFGEIFKANCCANGILPVTLKAADQARVMREAEAARSVAIDLMGCLIELQTGPPIVFDFPERQRRSMLAGLGEIDLIRRDDAAAITAFEAQQQSSMPWLSDAGTAPVDSRGPEAR